MIPSDSTKHELRQRALRPEKQGKGPESPVSKIIDNFSLVEGATGYHFQPLLGMAISNRRQVITRAIVTALLSWLPLLILSLFQSSAFGHGTKIPFLFDYAAHVRFLVALPLLVVAGMIIDPKVRIAVRHFVNSGLVTSHRLPAFEDALAKTSKLRDAPLAAALVAFAAFVPSFWLEGGEVIGSGTSTWHHLAPPGGDSLSLAGWWFALFSAPLYRLWLFRWVWLTIVWGIFLMRVSTLGLAWLPTHPDKAAGLAFLADTQTFFGWIGFAASATSAARFANMIAYEGQTLPGLKFLIIASCILTMGVLMAPLLVLSYRLYKIKESGIFHYGALGTRYVQAFDEKWIQGKRPGNEVFLGTADLQSLADLSNSFSVVDGMRLVLLDKETLFQLALPPALPMLVLLIVETPAEQLLHTVVKLMM